MSTPKRDAQSRRPKTFSDGLVQTRIHNGSEGPGPSTARHLGDDVRLTSKERKIRRGLGFRPRRPSCCSRRPLSVLHIMPLRFVRDNS
jgi:hypothetical protein